MSKAVQFSGNSSPYFCLFVCDMLTTQFCRARLVYRQVDSLQRDAYLKRTYGISQNDFIDLLNTQGGVCFICGNPPKTRNLHVDHLHVKNFKKLPPEEKKSYVRGLLCFQCNKLLVGRGMNLFKAERLVKYLTRFILSRVWTS